MIVAFSVTPAGGESDSVSAAVAEAVRVVRDSGLPYELNAMFTLVEGEWDEVMDVVRRAVEAASVGATRTSLVLKADIRPGYTAQLRAKVDRVTAHLAATPRHGDISG
ncbi:MAG: MTH1187 family thiamine-binding protein [Pseudonocardiaceae bacterium]